METKIEKIIAMLLPLVALLLIPKTFKWAGGAMAGAMSAISAAGKYGKKGVAAAGKIPTVKAWREERGRQKKIDLFKNAAEKGGIAGAYHKLKLKAATGFASEARTNAITRDLYKKQAEEEGWTDDRKAQEAMSAHKNKNVQKASGLLESIADKGRWDILKDKEGNDLSQEMFNDYAPTNDAIVGGALKEKDYQMFLKSNNANWNLSNPDGLGFKKVRGASPADYSSSLRSYLFKMAGDPEKAKTAASLISRQVTAAVLTKPANMDFYEDLEKLNLPEFKDHIASFHKARGDEETVQPSEGKVAGKLWKPGD